MGWPVQRLREEGHTPIGFYYNPNIQPEEEYQKRLEAARKIAKRLEFELIEGVYEPDLWLERVKGLEDEKEGGARCEVCFAMRLEAAYEKAKELGIPNFTSTLSVSPHKDIKKINKAGKNIDPEAFLDIDFKKNNGYKKSHDLAKQHGLYCQTFCGCVFSLNDRKQARL